MLAKPTIVGAGKPPAPPSNISSADQAPRKRITQRLVLGGKGVETGEINVGMGLKIPGAPDPIVSQMIPSMVTGGTLEVPVASLLGYIPVEFVTRDHEFLYQSPLSQQMASLPLGQILTLLPSGKIEILAHELSASMPPGVMKSADELGDYAYSPVALPLQEIISRIPEEALTLRSDQKPIDDSVTRMDDPFSAEMLAAAQEALRQQQEAGAFDINEPEDIPVAAPAIQEEPLAAEYAEAPVLESEDAPVAMESEEELESDLSDINQEDTVVGLPHEEEDNAPDALDLSFTQSEEYLKFLAQSESEGIEAATATQNEPELPPDQPFEEPMEEAQYEEADVSPVDYAEEEISLALPPDDLSDTEVTKIIPRAPMAGEIPSPAPTDADNPLFAPTRVIAKSKPAHSPARPMPNIQAKASAPLTGFKLPPPPSSKISAPAKAPSAITPPHFNAPPPAAANPAFSFQKQATLPPPPPTSAPLVAAAPSHAASDQLLSDRLIGLLGMRNQNPPTLKEVVTQMNSWPGMKGCIVGGKDGLKISSDMEDDAFANSIAAFAPKLISRITEIFQDMGFEEVQELHTPIRDSSVYVFRDRDLYLIALFNDVAFPESYRLHIKEVLKELNTLKLGA
ncbi:MAG: roadblock/LC7 domain-containing protein [Candidatus Methylacidiphilales bacterium]